RLVRAGGYVVRRGEGDDSARPARGLRRVLGYGGPAEGGAGAAVPRGRGRRDQRRPASYVRRRGRAARVGGEEGAGPPGALQRPGEARGHVGAGDLDRRMGHGVAPRPAVPPRGAGAGRRGRGSEIPLPVVGGAGASRLV